MAKQQIEVTGTATVSFSVLVDVVDAVEDALFRKLSDSSLEIEDVDIDDVKLPL